MTAASKPSPLVAPVRRTVLPAKETVGSVGGVYWVRRRRRRADIVVFAWGLEGESCEVRIYLGCYWGWIDTRDGRREPAQSSPFQFNSDDQMRQ